MKKIFLSLLLLVFIINAGFSQEKHQFDFPDNVYALPGANWYTYYDVGTWDVTGSSYYSWSVSQSGSVTLSNLHMWIGGGSSMPSFFLNGSTQTFTLTFDVPNNANLGSSVDINVMIYDALSGQQIYNGRYTIVNICYMPSITLSSSISNHDVDYIAQDYIELNLGFEYTTSSSNYEFTSYTADCGKKIDEISSNLKLEQTGGTEFGFYQGESIIDDILIYPNPSSNGIFSLDLNEENSDASVCVYNLSGKLIYENTNLNDRQTDIDLSGFGEGVFFLQLTKDGSVSTKKIVVSK